MTLVARTVSVVLLCINGACGAFGSDSGGEGADGGAPSPDSGVTSTATIRCGDLACPGTTKCCLPLENDSPRCIDRSAVCGATFGELLCSSGAACQAGFVCCVSTERNGGQTDFDISRSYCVTASACPDGNLQHSLCDLGDSAQCPGKACKPFVHDVNDAAQDLDINPKGYATCQ